MAAAATATRLDPDADRRARDHGVRGRDTGYLHEASDQLGALQRVCGSAVRAAGPAEAAAAIDAAFAGFASSRPRPAYVEILLDAFDRAGPVADEASAPTDPGDLSPLGDGCRSDSPASCAALVLGGGAAAPGEKRRGGAPGSERPW